MTAQLRPAVVMLLLFTALTGLAYPAAITGIAQLAFPSQANGSLVRDGDKIIGSSLIGQGFAGAGYFHGRPSAAGKVVVSNAELRDFKVIDSDRADGHRRSEEAGGAAPAPFRQPCRDPSSRHADRALSRRQHVHPVE